MTRESTKQWWENCHETGNFYISDYGGWRLWRTMNIARFVRPFRRVLEIGVGGGKNVRWLNGIWCSVCALDISNSALEKVKGITKGRWTEPESLPDGAFDLAISHVVAQHMDNAALERQMKNVLRSLRPSGLFAMQFADKIGGTTTETYQEQLGFQQQGAVCRSPEMVSEIVKRCGGEITWLSSPVNFPEFESRWFYVHIRPTDT